MIPKPDACLGCPFYGDGYGFVPDHIPPKAQLVWLGRNPGKDEELIGEPFLGRSGQILRGFGAQYLAAVSQGYANILKCRHQDARGRRTDDLPQPNTAAWKEVVTHCTKAHLRLPTGVLIVACGEHAAAWLVPELADEPELHVRGTYLEEVQHVWYRRGSP